MRKISFVLLFIALMCISGCGSEIPTPEDSHSAYGDMVSSEERNDTEEIFKTGSSEQSAVQIEAAEADESTVYPPEKNETVSSEQAAEESKNNQTKQPTSHASENSTSDTRPVETKPAEPEQSEPAETTPSESETSEPQPRDVYKRQVRDGVLEVTLPCLLPKRKQRQSTEFLIDPLYFTLSQYSDSNKLPKFQQCVVCFSHVYSEKFHNRRVRDYDKDVYKRQQLDT